MSDTAKHLALLRALRTIPMSIQEVAVLHLLCGYGDEEGKDIFPSKKTIATSVQMSEQGLARIYRQLQEKNYILEDGWYKRHKKWRINTELFLKLAKEKPKKEQSKRVSKPKKAPPIPPASPDTVNEAEETSEFPAQNHMQSTQNGHVRMPGLADFARELRRKNPLLSLPESHKLAQQMRERGEYEPTKT